MSNDLGYKNNSFTDQDLEVMAHGNNPVANAYRELLTYRLAAKKAEPVAWITVHQGCRAPDDCEDYLEAYTYKTDEKSVDGSDAFPVFMTPPPSHTEQHIDMVKMLRELVDVVWGEAKESTEVPSTSWADEMIAKVYPAAAPKPESK